MNNFQRDFLSIIKSSVTNNSVNISNDFDWQLALETAQKHSIVIMFFYGIILSKHPSAEKLQEKMTKYVYAMVSLNAIQENELKQIFQELNKNKIAYMPLKGCVLKKYYPCPEMRYMGDADILIRENQYVEIKEIMTRLNYNFISENDCEIIWNKPNALHIEFHKSLIAPYNKDFYSYFGDGWKFAKCKNNSEYSMNDEDCLIYIFTHLAKHFRNGGIGIKHFMDLWIYLCAKPELDKIYIENELEKLKLLEFFHNVQRMLSAWFDGGENDDITEFMTEWVFSCGTYGDIIKYSVSSMLRDKSTEDKPKDYRFRYYMQAIFYPYKEMSKKYHILNKAPVLLPIIWIWRIFAAILCKTNEIKEINSNINNLKPKNINKYHDELKYVGLDFNFRENKK